MIELVSESFDVDSYAVIKARAPVEVFMEAAILLGVEFLACGGPVTRLEAQLSAAGHRSGFDTTIHATPSSISIFCHDRQKHESSSRGQRIQSFGYGAAENLTLPSILNAALISLSIVFGLAAGRLPFRRQK